MNPSKKFQKETRRLRFEPLEDRVMLSVSPLSSFSDQHELSTVSLPEWSLETSEKVGWHGYMPVNVLFEDSTTEQSGHSVWDDWFGQGIIDENGNILDDEAYERITKEAWDNTAERAARDAQEADAQRDWEKAEQLVREGRDVEVIKHVTELGEIIEFPTFSKEYLEAIGPIVDYTTTIDDPINHFSDTSRVIPTILESDSEFSEEELGGRIEALENTAERVAREAQEAAARADWEKAEQLVREGKSMGTFEHVTESGDIIEGYFLTPEYIEALGGGVDFMTVANTSLLYPSSTQYSGVAYVTVSTAAGTFAGTGTLLTTGEILTCAHLFFSGNNQTGFASGTTVKFDNFSGIGVSEIIIHPDYVSSGGIADLAIIRLATPAPASVTRYDIFRGDTVQMTNNFTSFTKVGYGQYGYGGNTTRYSAGTKRAGQNTYDAFYGDSRLLAYDFDNGTPARDAIGNSPLGRVHLGSGSYEIMAAPGDSGGPNFITVGGNQLIAGVTKGGVTTQWDIDSITNSTFGEYGFDVNVSYYADWIDAWTKADVGDVATTSAATLISFNNDQYKKAERIGNGSYGTKDVDMYRLDVTSADIGKTYVFETAFPSGSSTGTSGRVDTYIRLFNSSGSQLTYDDDGGGGNYSKLSYTFTAAGTYYLGVSSYQNRAYQPTVAGSGPGSTAANATGPYVLTVNRSTTYTAPPVPAGLTASVVSSSQINLTWNASTYATSYTVQRSSNNGATWTTFTTTGTTYTNTGLTANTPYLFRVMATNSGSSSAYTPNLSATTKLATPTGLNANVVSSSRINLTWNAVVGATSYTVQRSTNGTTWTTLSTTVVGTSYASTSLATNTKYYYQVMATNSSNTSAYSTNVNATTKVVTPTGLSATVISNSQINLTWNLVSGATGYVVERSTTGAGNWTTVYTGSGTSCSSTGLNEDTKYFFRIKATVSGNQSAYAANVSGKTFWGTFSTPTGLTTKAVSSSQIKVGWNAVFGATSYTLERSTNQTTWTTVYTGSNTSFTNASLNADTPYFYRVRATNSSGSTTGYASSSSIKTKIATPLNFAASAISSSQVKLSWNSVTGATSYTLERSTDQSSWTNVYTGTNTNFTNTGLNANTKYYYRVKATNSGNSSDHSGTVTFTGGNTQKLPTAIIENADSLFVQESCSLPITASGIDPLGGGLTYLWDFGSGNFVAYTSNTAWFSAAQLNGYPGSTQTIRLKVRDANGVESPIVTAIVSIIDIPPTYYIDPPNSNQLIAGHYTSWYFSAYDVPYDPVMKWVVRWGDGTETIVNGGPRNSVQLGHVFMASGNLEITISTTDLMGIEYTFSFWTIVLLSDLV